MAGTPDVLVTGGAGFIGANLCRRLAASDAIGRVVTIDDLSTGDASSLDGVEAELVVGSILDADALQQAIHGGGRPVDAVVHLAALPSVPRSIANPVASHTANASGTVAVLEAARHAGVGHVVVASSSSVYGANPVLPKHEALVPQPMSPYAASKLATESYALAYQHSYGLPVLALRFFNVFGPGQPADHAYAAVVPTFAAAALEGRTLVVHGDGRQSRDFTSVGTVVTVLEDALTRHVSCAEPVNLAFGTRTNLLVLISMLEAIVGHELPREHVDARPGDVRHSQADATRLRELFPDVEPEPLDDALRATVDWLRTRR
jgi:UDP-glucose 4-epimerase